MLDEPLAAGKLKLVVLLAREGIHLSASRVGRILGYLTRTRQLIEPLRRFSTRRRGWKRQYATRKPKSYEARLPGDIVQLDTMDVRPEPRIVLKQFTTVVVSRWPVPTVASNATTNLATKALEPLIERNPVAINAIQMAIPSSWSSSRIAGGTKGILLLEPSLRSPKLNCHTECANRTYRKNSTTTLTPHQRLPASPNARGRWEHIYATSALTRRLANSPPPRSQANFNITPTRQRGRH